MDITERLIVIGGALLVCTTQGVADSKHNMATQVQALQEKKKSYESGQPATRDRMPDLVNSYRKRLEKTIANLTEVISRGDPDRVQAYCGRGEAYLQTGSIRRQ